MPRFLSDNHISYLYSFSQACDFIEQCRACEDGQNIIFVSQKSAISVMGCDWWFALIEQLKEYYHDFITVLDCNDNAAIALTVLSMGQKKILFDERHPSFEEIKVIYQKNHGELFKRSEFVNFLK